VHTNDISLQKIGAYFMRLVSTENIQVGSVLAKSIVNEREQVLLQEGVVLTERLIKRLRELGVSLAYIKDHENEVSELESAVSEVLRKKTKKIIQDTYTKMSRQETVAGSSLVLESASKEYIELMRTILDEVREQEALLDLISDIFIVDDYIFTHSFNVTLYSVAIGLKLHLPIKQLETLGLGALLHDVGKLKVPRDILLKPGKLTEEEFEEIKRHADYGYTILKEVKTIPLIVAHCAYQHHERLDGTGYPRGLKEDEIQYLAKIIAVADVFDAVTSNRVYRKAMLPHEGLEILYAGCGRLFDLKIVEAFRSAVAVYPVGLTVELSNNTIGIVKRQNIGLSDRPIIEIIEENGKRIHNRYLLDLSEQLDLVIVKCNIEINN